MTLFNVDYVGYERVGGSIAVEAHDADEAEDLALERIHDDIPELEDVAVEGIREVNGGR